MQLALALGLDSHFSIILTHLCRFQKHQISTSGTNVASDDCTHPVQKAKSNRDEFQLEA